MNLLCGYYPIGAGHYERLRGKGELLYSIFKKVNHLYRDAIINNNKEMLEIFETGSLRSKILRALHRKMFLQYPDSLPLISRIDSPDGEHCVDCHVGFRGLGYIYALRNVAERYFGSDRFFNSARLKLFANAVGLFFKSASAEITLYMRVPEHREVCYVWEQMFGPCAFKSYPGRKIISLPHFSYGFHQRQIHVSPRDFYDSIKFKRTPLAFSLWLQNIILRDKYDAVLQHLNSTVVIEPPPHLLYEQKTIPAILYNPRFKEFFSSAERELFPESYIISTASEIKFNGKKYSLDDIVNLPSNQRTFVVKYAGMDLNLDWGGQSVYRIKAKSKRWTQRFLKKVVDSYRRYKEPWIIQNDISQKEEVSYFDSSLSSLKQGEYYKLFRPYFIRLPDQERIEIIDANVLFKNTFKVHGQNDCVIGLISLGK